MNTSQETLTFQTGWKYRTVFTIFRNFPMFSFSFSFLFLESSNILCQLENSLLFFCFQFNMLVIVFIIRIYFINLMLLSSRLVLVVFVFVFQLVSRIFCVVLINNSMKIRVCAVEQRRWKFRNETEKKIV